MLYAAKPVTQRSSNLFCVNVSGDTIYSLSTIFGYRFIFSFLFYLRIVYPHFAHKTLYVFELNLSQCYFLLDGEVFRSPKKVKNGYNSKLSLFNSLFYGVIWIYLCAEHCKILHWFGLSFTFDSLSLNYQNLLDYKSDLVLQFMWSIYEIIHICTAVVDDCEEWSSQ